MSKYETPLRLNIPLPDDISYIRGEGKRYGKEHGKMLSVRFNMEELKLVDAATEILGVKLAHLVRHCVVKYSEALIKHRTEWIKEKLNVPTKPNPSG